MEMNHSHQTCENKNEEYLYKIGVFAAMNHVTVKALRFYEEQGLLAPAYINEENGYRYYTMSQMAVVHQISALKQAGFSLEEIARINGGADGKVLLQSKKAKILNQMAELTRQLAMIDSFLAKEDVKLDTPVLVKTLPAVKIVSMQARIDSYDCLFDLMPQMGQKMEEAGLECAIPEYCFTSYPEAGYKDEDILVETCQSIVKEGTKVEGLKYVDLPQTQAACIFHHGSYSGFAKTYEIVLRYIEENGLEICGPIRENYIDGIWNKEEESQWLSEIQIPVKK